MMLHYKDYITHVHVLYQYVIMQLVWPAKPIPPGNLSTVNKGGGGYSVSYWWSAISMLSVLDGTSQPAPVHACLCND